MVLLGTVHLAMGMVLPIMVWDMVVMVVMVVPILDMEALLVHPMETQMSQMLVMQVGHLVPLEVHGILKHPQDMVLWAMEMLLLGVQALVVVLEVVVLVQHLQVNLLAELLGMEIKVMDMEGMVEVRDLTQIQLVMVLLEGVLVVVQIAMLVGESYRGVVVATWEVAMVMLMGIQDMEMHHGNLIHHRLLEIMELRQMVLMVGKLAMVVDIVLSPDKPSSSSFVNISFQPVHHLCKSIPLPSHVGYNGFLFQAAEGVVLAGCQACFGTGWIA